MPAKQVLDTVVVDIEIDDDDDDVVVDDDDDDEGMTEVAVGVVVVHCRWTISTV